MMELNKQSLLRNWSDNTNYYGMQPLSVIQSSNRKGHKERKELQKSPNKRNFKPNDNFQDHVEWETQLVRSSIISVLFIGDVYIGKFLLFEK